MKKKNMYHLNLSQQFYKDIPIRLINRYDYDTKSAKRFVLGNSNQNIWIPNKHLHKDGTIIKGENLDYIFWKAYWDNKFYYANLDFMLV